MKFFSTTLPFCVALVAGLQACLAADPVAGAKTVATDPDEVLRSALPESGLPGLKEALERAMRNSSRVISSLLDLDQAKVSEKQARSPMLPYASFSASFGVSQNQYDYDAFPVRDVNGNPVLDSEGKQLVNAETSTNAVVQDLSYNAGANQPVFHWGALKKGYRSAQLQTAISSRNVEEIRRSLAIEIRRAYFSLIATANNHDVEKATLARLEEEREYLKKQAQDGFITSSSASSADTRIEDYKRQMERSRIAYEAQWDAFCDLTGLEKGAPIPDFPKEIPAIAADFNKTLPNLAPNPGSYTPVNLQNADDSIRIEKYNYEIASTRLRPKFGVGVNASRGYHSPDTAIGFGGPYTLTSVGVNATVNWSIFDGFSTQAAKQSSRIRLRQQERLRDQSKKGYDETLKSNLTNLRLNWQTLQRTEENLRDTRSSVETYKKDYESGVAPKQVWDAAQISAENALYAANNARADYYLQIVSYLSLRGKDPAPNYRPNTTSSDASKN